MVEKKIALRGMNVDKIEKTMHRSLNLDSSFISVVDRKTSENAIVCRLVINNLDFDLEKNPYTRSVRYVSDIRYDPNPNYQMLLSQLESARSRLQVAEDAYSRAKSASSAADTQNALTVLGAMGKNSSGLSPQQSLSMLSNSVTSSNALSSARDAYNRVVNEINSIKRELDRTPSTIKREVYSTHSYTIYDCSLNGNLSAEVSMLLPNGVCIFSKPLTFSYSKTDSTHEGFNEANLKEDPLILPSERDLVQIFEKQLDDSVANALGLAIDALWEKEIEAVKSLGNKDVQLDRMVSLALQWGGKGQGIADTIGKRIKNLPSDAMKRLENMIAEAM